MLVNKSNRDQSYKILYSRTITDLMKFINFFVSVLQFFYGVSTIASMEHKCDEQILDELIVAEPNIIGKLIIESAPIVIV